MRNIKKALSVLIIVLIHAMCGALIGLGALFLHGLSLPALLAVIFTAFAAAWILSTVVHELGHLCFGLLTGYRLISVRFLSFAFVRGSDEKMHLKSYSLPGTSGQCLMVPDESADPDRHPFFLYHAGGIIFNLLTGVSAMLLLPSADSVPLIKTLLYSFAVASLTVGVLLNALPFYAVNNDGKNILELMKNRHGERRYIFNQFRIYAGLTNGMRMKDIDEKYFCFEENDLCSSMGYSSAAATVERLVDERRFGKARELCLKLLALPGGICPLNENEIYAANFFLELITDGEPGTAYDSRRIQKIFSSMRTMPCICRCEYAYHLLYKNDEIASAKCRNAFDRLLMKYYPYDGEADSERGLIELIDRAYRSIKDKKSQEKTNKL